MGFDVIPLGRVAIDFNPTDINRPLEESCNFQKYLGGSPANIAMGMAKLGKKVGFIGKVSDDQFGRFVVETFEKANVDTSNIAIAKNGESLGLTFTEMKSPTESSILMYRNNIADLALDYTEINKEYIQSAKMLLVSGTALAASPSREAAFTAVEYAKQANVKIVFDVDYRNYTWNNENELAVYYSLIGKMADIILGSREEFTLMEGLICQNNEDDKKTAELWQSYGAEIIVIKHGKQGSTAYTKKEVVSVKPFPTNVMKSFGGGDGYASAFLYALLEKYDVIDALEFASASASMLVSAHSCSAAMPTVTEIKDFMTAKKAEYGENVVR